MQEVALSIISPVYGAADTIPTLCKKIHKAASTLAISYEIILVFDCSPDTGWEKINAECQKNPSVTGIKLSRNFGQHIAIAAGIDNCSGEWVVILDCDLQDNPEEILNLYNKAQEGFDIVLCRRKNRKDPFLKKMSSRLFYKALHYISGMKTDSLVANFGIYNRKVINSIKQIKESNQFFPMFVIWSGFKSTSIAVEHSERFAGVSAYSTLKRLKLGIDIAFSYSSRPLLLTSIFAIFIALIIMILCIIYFFLALAGYFQITGFATLILSLWGIGSIIIIILSCMSIYISQIYDNVKQRPLYLIDEVTNVKQK